MKNLNHQIQEEDHQRKRWKNQKIKNICVFFKKKINSSGGVINLDDQPTGKFKN